MLDISLKQMRYAVEIAQCGSINQAAQNLYVTQSSLSKAMKELENVLGYAVFQRTPAGTAVTEEGQPFLELAHQIVYKMEVLERQLQNRNERLAAMKISIPRATYITYAFTEFFKEIQNQEQIQINFSETNSQEAVDNILNHGFQLGIIRYPEFLEESNRQLLHQKHLRVKPIWTFTYRLLVSRESVLATKELIAPEELAGFTELVHGDEQTLPAGGCRGGAEANLPLRAGQSVRLPQQRAPDLHVGLSPAGKGAAAARAGSDSLHGKPLSLHGCAHLP